MPASNIAASPSATPRPPVDLDDIASINSASPVATSPSNGTKRKRVSEPKFYAVRVGHRPGIYHSWSECLEQVKGFKNATFKSFPSLTDAERFLAGENPGQLASSSVNLKFYAVKSGRIPGIYTDWPSAQKQITGWTKPKHKCFSTRTEAQKFMDDGEGKIMEDVDNGISELDSRLMSHMQEAMKADASEPFNKKSKKSTVGNGYGKSTKQTIEECNPEDYEPGTGPLPPGSEDGFDTLVVLDPTTGKVMRKSSRQNQATKLQATGPASGSHLRIYTDGSSLRNGQSGAFAGVGVYFGPNDERNLSETLPGSRQTNQRAELTAIVRALDTVPRDRDVTIVTDSQYSIKCATEWWPNWRKNGWKASTGKAVENRDIIENIVGKIEERNQLQLQTAFEWIKGHSNDPGNEAADKLAVQGARRAAQLD